MKKWYILACVIGIVALAIIGSAILFPDYYVLRSGEGFAGIWITQIPKEFRSWLWLSAGKIYEYMIIVLLALSLKGLI